MRNAKNDIIFPQDVVDSLESLFNEDAKQFNKLSSPLSNVNISLNGGDDPEN